ncbi:MAG: TolC family protein [Bacteroidota bacterium]
MRKNFILILALISVVHLGAQDQLSLADAIRLGLANNYDVRIERGNVDVARLNNNWGEVGIFPTITASAIGSRNIFDNQEAINPFQILGKTITTQIQPAVNLNWDLLSLHNITITKRRLEQLQAESEGNASIVIANTIQSIILGYYIAVLESERLKQFQTQLELSRDKYTRVRVRQEIGSAITSDVLLEEGNYLTDSVSFVNQELIYKNAISNLNFVLGIAEPAPDYVLSDSMDRDMIEVDLLSLIDLMEQENVDVRRQYITQSVLGLETELSKWDRYPTLLLGANYTLTRNEQDVSDWPLNRREITDGSGNVVDVLSVGNNQNRNYGVNFTVSFTLFNGGRINRAIRRAQIEEGIGELRIENLKTSLRRDLKQAVDQYNTRKQLYQINIRRKAAAKQNLDIARDKFQNGTIDSFDFRTIQNVFLISSIQELDAVYDLIDSKVTLMRLTGGLVRVYNQ